MKADRPLSYSHFNRFYLAQRRLANLLFFVAPISAMNVVIFPGERFSRVDDRVT
jgi:hypothetical protein